MSEATDCQCSNEQSGWAVSDPSIRFLGGLVWPTTVNFWVVYFFVAAKSAILFGLVFGLHLKTRCMISNILRKKRGSIFLITLNVLFSATVCNLIVIDRCVLKRAFCPYAFRGF